MVYGQTYQDEHSWYRPPPPDTRTAPPPRYFAMAADFHISPARVRELARRYGGNIMIGVNIHSSGWQATAAAVREVGGRMMAYTEGPGGPTGSSGYIGGEMERMRQHAAQMGITGADWRRRWDGGGWKRFIFEKQFPQLFRQGFFAAEIDNLHRVIGDSPQAHVNFLREYFERWQRGDMPQLMLKNISESQMQAIVAAVKQNPSWRQALADYHIYETSAGSNPSRIAALSAQLGIRTRISTNTYNYQTEGDYGLNPQQAAVPPGPVAAIPRPPSAVSPFATLPPGMPPFLRPPIADPRLAHLPPAPRRLAQPQPPHVASDIGPFSVLPPPFMPTPTHDMRSDMTRRRPGRRTAPPPPPPPPYDDMNPDLAFPPQPYPPGPAQHAAPRPGPAQQPPVPPPGPYGAMQPPPGPDMVMPTGMTSPAHAAFAALGGLSQRRAHARDEVQGFQRFGDFMKDVLGLSGPGFRRYAPLSPQELGVIGQMLGVDPATMRGADGRYNPDVVARVTELAAFTQRFQQMAGLNPDGVIGVRTAPMMMSTSVLDAALAAGRTPAAPDAQAAPQPAPQAGPDGQGPTAGLPPQGEREATTAAAALPTMGVQESPTPRPSWWR